MSDEPEDPTPAPEDTPTEDPSSAPQDDLAASTQDPVPPAPGVGPVAIGQGKLSESDDKTFGMLAHLLGPLTSFIGPLIIWLIKREESPFVDDQGKESLNFQITIAIGIAVVFFLSMIPIIQCVAILLFPALGVIDLIFGILGCVEANKGNLYRYPFNIRIVT